MSTWRSRAAVRLLVLLCVTGVCTATQQQQQRQQQQQQRLSRSPRRVTSVWHYIKDDFHAELQPIIERLETQMNTLYSRLASRLDTLEGKLTQLDSRVETLDSRLAQLDSRVDELTARVHEGDEAQPHTAQVEEGSEEPQPEPELIQQPEPLPRGCSELPTGSASGIHQVQLQSEPSRPPITAVCDMDTDGGNWTVFQRRGINKPRQNFFLRWDDYKEGFGDLTGEFWWGLENLWLMTSGRDREYELRIDLEDFGGAKAHAVYRGFRISSEDEGYKLTVTSYTGTAGDSLRAGVNRKFSTRDRDHDTRSRGSCAKRHGGAWWYGGCGDSSLNGRRHRSRRGGFDIKGIWWFPWKRYDSLKSTEMKIRCV